MIGCILDTVNCADMGVVIARNFTEFLQRAGAYSFQSGSD